MSWIVEHLIRNKNSIKSRVTYADPLDSAKNLNILDLEEDDEYNNLLLLESKIRSLYKYKILSDIDILILDSAGDNNALTELKQIIRDRHTIATSFSQICDRLAFFLGDYFTDDGLLTRMQEDFNLSDSDRDKIKRYMSGRFSTKLIRNTK